MTKSLKKQIEFATRYAISSHQHGVSYRAIYLNKEEYEELLSLLGLPKLD